MSGGEIGALVYMVLLLIFIGSYFFLGGRQRVSTTVQQALIWMGIFAMVIIAYGFRDVLEAQLFPRSAQQVDTRTIALSRSPGGSFLTTVEVNGRSIDFLVDTGASEVVLTLDDARRVGLEPEELAFTGSAMTANGLVDTAPVTLDVMRLADFTARDVPASVNGGELAVSLLGLTYLNRFDRIEIRGDRMLLVR